MILEFMVYPFLDSSFLKVEQENDPFINSAPTGSHKKPNYHHDKK